MSVRTPFPQRPPGGPSAIKARPRHRGQRRGPLPPTSPWPEIFSAARERASNRMPPKIPPFDGIPPGLTHTPHTRPKSSETRPDSNEWPLYILRCARGESFKNFAEGPETTVCPMPINIWVGGICQRHSGQGKGPGTHRDNPRIRAGKFLRAGAKPGGLGIIPPRERSAAYELALRRAPLRLAFNNLRLRFTPAGVKIC